ncbi:hypothetical protein [Paenibacillus sp. R14(2021)]|uniref:hypothetical protein n=1 Tax=Paenibacillus sp. R14(2021) TaxID=2859228 RepID=UPI001C613965|nr:hypothetical protein [Paenibacillus sp. R14(2021)]
MTFRANKKGLTEHTTDLPEARSVRLWMTKTTSTTDIAARIYRDTAFLIQQQQ